MSIPVLGAVQGWEEWVAFSALIVGFVGTTVGIINRWVVQPIVKNQRESAREEAEKVAVPIVKRLDGIELSLAHMQGRFDQHDWEMHHNVMPDRPEEKKP